MSYDHYEVMGYYDGMYSGDTFGHMANYEPERWADLTQEQRDEYDRGWDDVYIPARAGSSEEVQ